MNARTTHTSGPWEAKALDPNHFIIHAGDSEGSSVAKTLIPLGLDVVTATVRANAKLLAAAPDLLEALQALGTFLRADGVSVPADLLEQCNAAVVKATR